MKLGAMIGATTLPRLRARSAVEFLDASGRADVPKFDFSIDGDFFPDGPAAIYAQGKQAHVPRLAGWTYEKLRGWYLVPDLTASGLDAALQKTFGVHATAARAVYGGSTPAEIAQSATDITSDQFMAYCTWRWLEEQSRIAPFYRHVFRKARPALAKPMPAGTAPASPWDAIPLGAPHSTEIEYALGNLSGNPVYAWTADDRTAPAPRSVTCPETRQRDPDIEIH